MIQPGADSMSFFPKRDRRHDVFVSHASEDVEIARKLCASLEKSGWRVFLAARDLPGELKAADWSQRIDEALDGCGVLVLLASPEALNKRWVTYEWRSFHDEILADKGGWLVPCCVRDLAPDQLGRALRRYQIVDLRAERDWEAGFFSLLTIIEGYLKRPIARGRSVLRSVLTIEGNMVGTILAARILERLEEAILQVGGGCLADHVDLIVGNSVGGALAALLAQGARVAESIEAIQDVLCLTFERNFWPYPRYSSKKLIESMVMLFADAGLSAAPKCGLSTFDFVTGEHRLWSSYPELGGTEPGPALASLTAACIAYPFYFHPIGVEGSDSTRHLLVDGALVEPIPCRVGLESIRRLFSPSPLISDIILVDVGSGRSPTNLVSEKKKPGLLHWFGHLPGVLMRANRQLVHEQVERLYRAVGTFENYRRLDPVLPSDSQWHADDLDALPLFAKFGRDWADSRSEQILQAAQLLMRRCDGPSNNSMQPQADSRR